MSVTAAQIARVRALSNAAAADFDDAAVTLAIELYPRIDADGNDPDDDDWTETFDLYRAAADIVDQRAAKLATSYDVTADGATMSRSQMFSQLSNLATRLRNRAAVRISRRVIEDTTSGFHGENDDS